MSVNIRRSKKYIVESLCGSNPIVWTKTTAFGDIPMYRSICPKQSCQKRIDYAQKSGYSNPYSRILSCIGSTNVEKMMHEYEEHRKKEAGGQSLIPFQPKVGINDKEKSIIAWITIIVKKSLPLSFVEDNDMREFAQSKVPVSIKLRMR